MSRKIKQIAGSDNRIYALCEDGTLWELNHSGEWDEHPAIPETGNKVEAKSTVDEVWFCIKPDIFNLNYTLIYWTKPDRSDIKYESINIPRVQPDALSPTMRLREKFPDARINCIPYDTLEFYGGAKK